MSNLPPAERTSAAAGTMAPDAEPTARILDDLGAGRRIAEPVLVVVAHADDETIGLGTRLRLFDDLMLIHLTDGAPRRRGNARTHYAATRRAELREVLRILEVRGDHVQLPNIDQELVLALDDLAASLAPAVASARYVFTHAYEGGHPDHDAAALVIARLCETLGGRAPARLEFSGYYRQGEDVVANSFFDGDPDTTLRLTLDESDQALRRRAFEAYPSQAGILRRFSRDEETVRVAPDYDFTRPPPPGAFHYDQFNWPIDGAQWLRLARDYLAA